MNLDNPYSQDNWQGNDSQAHIPAAMRKTRRPSRLVIGARWPWSWWRRLGGSC